MKKLAFPIAMITSVTAWCLCAFLLALTTGIIAYGLLSGAFTHAPLTLSTEASVPVTNPELHISFKQPEGWVLIDSGRDTTSHHRYAIYGLKGRTHAPVFTIYYSDIVSDETSDWYWRGADVIDELYETIDGITADGVRFVKGGKVAFVLVQLGSNHTFEWTSDVKYSDELEQIYRNMLPTITFVHPTAMPIPVITATPPSGDTYLHPLRPKTPVWRRTPRPDFILGPMLSPELKAVVRNALSALKTCSPETWSFVLQYTYAVNAPPTPQMNYHMVRYSGVVLLSQTDLFRWPSQSLREFAAMAAIVHQSRHLWQSETHFIANPDVLERDAYRFELQVFDIPACVSTVPMEDRASLAIMRRTVEESILNPPTASP